ncbi:MAG: helix-turn-helix transcriptional regulator [Pseudomonadales bacterium]
MTNSAIAAEVGRRIEQIRLERNIPQQVLAAEVGLTPKTYRSLVSGKGKFENIIAVLRVLGCLELVEQFIPGQVFSPIEQLKLKGKQRQRASGRGSAPDKKQDLDW